MGNLRNIKRRDVLRAFVALGFEEQTWRGKGSHVRLQHVEDRDRRTILPKRDPVAVGTLRAMLKQASVSEDEFLDALGR